MEAAQAEWIQDKLKRMEKMHTRMTKHHESYKQGTEEELTMKDKLKRVADEIKTIKAIARKLSIDA